MMILVDKEDGTCSECGGQLEITGVDEVSLDAACTECDHDIHVQNNFFRDNGTKYWPRAMVAFNEHMNEEPIPMNPQQTFDDMLTAMKEKIWDDVYELAESLQQWLEKGGFPPTTLGDASLGKKWHQAVATFACLAALSKVDDIQKRRERRRTKTASKGDE